jgi:chromosome segregation ATPase
MEPANIISLISVLIAAGSLFVVWRRAGPERDKLRAEALKVNSERRNLDIDSLCDTVIALHNEIERLRADMRQERVETHATIASLRQDLDEALAELDLAQVQLAADTARIGELEAENGRLKQALERSLDASRLLKKDLDRAKQKIRALENGSQRQCDCKGESS